jgi:tetratricopeptide (TPR) repeat protein
VVELEQIVKRDPFPPSWYWDAIGSAFFQLRRYQEAIDAYNMANERQPWQIAYTAASLVYLERLDEAQHQTRTLLAEHPTMTISKMLKTERWQTEEARNHLITGLRKAGLPE